MIQVQETITTLRTVELDPLGDGFYARVMKDNHTFERTKTGTLQEVKEALDVLHAKEDIRYQIYHVNCKEGNWIFSARYPQELLDFRNSHLKG